MQKPQWRLWREIKSCNVPWWKCITIESGWSRKNCAHAPTYFCTIVCKCHFPLRWCKALLRGTFLAPLPCTARSNIILNLLSNRTQQFGEMGARRSPASATPSAGILWAGILRALDCLLGCWSNRAMACTLSLFHRWPMRWWTRRATETISENFTTIFLSTFSPFQRCKLSWGLHFMAMTHSDGYVQNDPDTSYDNWFGLKRDASRPGTLPLGVKGSLVGAYLYTVGQETRDATTACSNQVCALGVSAFPPCSCIPYPERLGYLHFQTTFWFRARFEGWHWTKTLRRKWPRSKTQCSRMLLNSMLEDRYITRVAAHWQAFQIHC